MKPIFVTGTDTGVGKTRVAVALLTALAARGLTVAGLKPVASGSESTVDGLRNSDALALLGATTIRAAYGEVNPYTFAPAIAPHVAAAEAGIEIQMPVLERALERLSLRAQAIVIEGAGGWLTPLGGGRTLADFAVAAQCRVVLVVGLRLGCLNHALLTAQAIRSAGLDLAGWVANGIDPAFERREANLATLTNLLTAPCLGALPYDPDRNPRELADRLALEPLLAAAPDP